MDRTPSKRVLIVTSSYDPVIIADMQRARLLAWDLKQCGWQVNVLAPGIEFQRHDCIDPAAAALFCRDTPCSFAHQRFRWLFERLQMRSIGWRALLPMFFLGCRLLRENKIDLIYFSTTQFILFTLGPLWKRCFGIPYVLDFHDPWRRNRRGAKTTPHRFKLFATTVLAHILERFAVTRASGIIAVSPTYIEVLRSRYHTAPALSRRTSAVVPFAARDSDLQLPKSNVSPPTSNQRRIVRIVYVGAGGELMAKSFERVAQLVAAIITSGESSLALRLEFYGTGEAGVFTRIAAKYGLAGIVVESPSRVFYSNALELALRASGLLVLGVDDPAYMPSKLFTYALTGLPLLACLHWQSQARVYFKEVPNLGCLVAFGNEIQAGEASRGQMRNFLRQCSSGTRTDRNACLEPFLSLRSAQRHATLFDDIIGATG